jgi:predicted ATPase
MKCTKWRVITGPPCSGKTTLIEKLEAMGYPVVHEVARSLLAAEMTNGRTADQVRSEKPTLQWDILYRKLDIEQQLPKDQLVFLDRGIPDSIAYFKRAGIDPQEPIAASRLNRYRQVFFLNPPAHGKYQKDVIRTEAAQRADAINDALWKSYTMLGYEPIRIPDVDADERLRHLLDLVEETESGRSKESGRSA